MPRFAFVATGCITTGLVATACATAPVQTAAGYANASAHGAYGVASTGAHVVYTTGGDVYSGVGRAAKQPFHDFNIMQDPIPAVLLRTESMPYDLSGVQSCEAVLDQVAELDLALGPDLDSPKDRGRNRSTRGADAAASAALLAAADAADHFIPMRSVIKEVSGATRYENHVKHAVLAGTVRRAFLKAIGMSHNCGWPASPLVFNAAQVAIASGAWTSPGGVQAVAIVAPTPLAVPPVGSSVGSAYPQSGAVASTAVQTRGAAVRGQTTKVALRRSHRRPMLKDSPLGRQSAQNGQGQAVAIAPSANQPGAMQTAALTSGSSSKPTAPAFVSRTAKVEPSADAFASSASPAFVSNDAPAPPWGGQTQSRP